MFLSPVAESSVSLYLMLVNSVILFLILGSSIWPGTYYVHQEAGFGMTDPPASSYLLGVGIATPGNNLPFWWR